MERVGWAQGVPGSSQAHFMTQLLLMTTEQACTSPLTSLSLSFLTMKRRQQRLIPRATVGIKSNRVNGALSTDFLAPPPVSSGGPRKWSLLPCPSVPHASVPSFLSWLKLKLQDVYQPRTESTLQLSKPLISLPPLFP